MLESTEGRFEVGDFVFAKLKGHPHWPATISQIETLYANGTSGQERTRYNVYFYGSHQMSMIKVDSIVRYDAHYELFKRRYANNPKFMSALQELEADKETREDYVKSLQECFAESSRLDGSLDKPSDEMFSSSDDSSETEDATSSIDEHSPTISSGFGDGFDSDEEYQALQKQKYEILSIERVPYGESSDYLLVISLGFNERDLRGDFEDIREEIRMMSCFVRLERLSQVPIRKVCSLTKFPKEGVAGHGRHWRKASDDKKRRRNKWRTGQWGIGTGNTSTKPSLTVLAAEAVKRRRRQRKTRFRDEARLLSLRQRNVDSMLGEGESEGEGAKACSCLPDRCECLIQQPPAITCPICKAQFSSSVDYKQHSFNIHIMGL